MRACSGSGSRGRGIYLGIQGVADLVFHRVPVLDQRPGVLGPVRIVRYKITLGRDGGRDGWREGGSEGKGERERGREGG